MHVCARSRVDAKGTERLLRSKTWRRTNVFVTAFEFAFYDNPSWAYLSATKQGAANWNLSRPASRVIERYHTTQYGIPTFQL
jgi:hypothetical protein